jgi:hypothetical protein
MFVVYSSLNAITLGLISVDSDRCFDFSVLVRPFNKIKNKNTHVFFSRCTIKASY